MSHAFYVEGVRRLAAREIAGLLGESRLRFVKGTSLPDDGGWPVGVSHLYVDGVSSRPLETSYGGEGELLEVRVLTCTDRETTELGCRLARLAAKHGHGTVLPEDAEDKLVLRDFEARYGDDWVAEHTRINYEMMRSALRQGASSVSMSGVSATLELGPRSRVSLPDDPDGFMAELNSRFRLLNYPDAHDVFFSSVMLIQSKDRSRCVRLGSYAGVSTALSARTDLVFCGRDESAVQVPLERFVELCGAGGHWLSEDLFLAPRLDAGAYSALIERLRPHAPQDIFAHGRTSEEERASEEAAGLTTTEHYATTISRVPAIIFVLVAGADGQLERKEIEAFQQTMRELEQSGPEVLADLIHVGLKNFQETARAVVEGQLDPAAELSKAADAIEKKFAAQAGNELKLAFLGIATRLAQANAKGLFRKKIREEEARAVLAVKSLLRVQVPKRE